ncbi:PucR family transcriptional regulator [Nonomuraea wenchangensis]
MSSVRAPRVAEQLTVDELVRYGPLGRAQMLVGEDLGRRVSRVALVSELDQIRSHGPGTVVVLSATLGHGAWMVESALRLAWERSASCLVSPAEAGPTSATAQLATRMRLPVFAVGEDPAAYALELAAVVASPEAARARLAARCAELFAERSSPRGILGVINAEVPGVTAALLLPDGHLLAGQSAAARAEHQVRVEVPGPDGRRWADLVAGLAAPPAPAWAESVRLILRLARAPLTTSVARERVSAVYGAEQARAALTALFARPGHAVEAEPGVDLPGWRLEGRHVAVFLRTDPALEGAGLSPGVVSAWQEVLPELPLAPWQDGWASWWTEPEIESGQVAAALRRHLARMRVPVPLSAGVGRAAEGGEGLRASLEQAVLAAGATVRLGHGEVRTFDELGYRALLGTLGQAELAASARLVLADLLAAPDGPVLVVTLAAVLDCGGSTGRAAARLGLHRNTVLGRVERIRARGVDFDHPDQRLALHLACYALLPELQNGQQAATQQPGQ